MKNEKISEPEWIVTCNRFITFMDIMGFKDMVYRNDHNDVLNIMNNISNNIEIFENDFKNRKSGQKRLIETLSKMIKPVIFSDSIILISMDDSESAFRDINSVSGFLLYESLISGIPMKGAIAHGKFTADPDKSIYFGKPLIDAYEIQDEMVIYGLILHHTAEKYIIENKLIEDSKEIEINKYKTPLKKGIVEHYMSKISPNKEYSKILLNNISRLYFNTSGHIRKYIDNTVEYLKWEEQLNDIK